MLFERRTERVHQCGVLMKYSNVSDAGTSSIRNGTIAIPFATARSISR